MIMKKLILCFLSLALAVGTIQAQDAGKALKAAKKALGTYNLDPSNNADKLVEAQKSIDQAIANIGSFEAKDVSKAWLAAGKIYNEIASKDVAQKVVDPTYKPATKNAALVAVKAFMEAKSSAVKKYESKDALAGMKEGVAHLSNIGMGLYDSKDYEGAYDAFKGVLLADELLKANKVDSTLPDETAVNDMRFAAGLAAMNANKEDDAAPIFQKLFDSNYDKPAVYEALYKIKSKNSPADALAILEAARAKFPDDVSLLFAEINHYLKDGKLDVLTGKLKTAIEKEPENISLYSTLGNVYDNLFQKEMEAGNEAKADEYFGEAMSNYEAALQKDDKYFEAIYSIGALYYNKAAAKTKELAALDSDYSKEGLRKYEAKKAEVFTYFDKALPYFERADSIKATDMNTLIALKEIYARKDQLEKSGAIKKRIEALGN